VSEDSVSRVIVFPVNVFTKMCIAAMVREVAMVREADTSLTHISKSRKILEIFDVI
jgi:hypothetical protein